MGKGISSVTLSTKNQSVTLTPETFKRAGELIKRFDAKKPKGARRGAAGMRVVEGEEGEEGNGGLETRPTEDRDAGAGGAEVKVEPIVRIVRVKREATRMIIEWERQRSDGRGAGTTSDSDVGKVSEGFDAIAMKCADEPARSFEDAMEVVTRLAVEEIGFGLIRERVKFGSVSFSWTKEIMGATVSTRVNVERRQSPVILTVPHAPSQPYADGGDPEMCLGEELTAALWKLHAEALAYIDGRRRQLGLFDPAEAAEEESSPQRR